MNILDQFINELNNLKLLTEDDIKFKDLNQLTSKILEYTINFEDLDEFNKYMNELATYNMKLDIINKFDELSHIIEITNNIKKIIDLLNIIEYQIKID